MLLDVVCAGLDALVIFLMFASASVCALVFLGPKTSEEFRVGVEDHMVS